VDDRAHMEALQLQRLWTRRLRIVGRGGKKDEGLAA